MQNFGWQANLTDDYMSRLNNVLVSYGITDMRSIRLFMATCGYESGKGRWTIELDDGRRYENSIDLGNTQPGDGSRFKGGGYMQLTGRYIYQRFANAMNNQNIMQGVEYVAANYLWESAAWFWANHTVEGSIILNNFVIQNGDTIGAFFLTQCWVVGWPAAFNNRNNPLNDSRLTFNVRDSLVQWEVRNNRLYVEGRRISAAPNGWADRERNFQDAQRIFR